MIPSSLDPTRFTALQSLDLGNVLSLDGRAHPLDALTPVAVVNVPATVVPAGISTGPTVTAASFPGSSVVQSLFPKNIGARLVVAVIAVAIIVIVTARLIL